MRNNRKSTFIAALRRFAAVGGETLYDPEYDRVGYMPYRGEQTLALGLAQYLDDPAVPSEVEGINWYHDLHLHMAAAFVEFRTLSKWQSLRDAYNDCAGEPLDFDLVDAHVGGLRRLLMTNQLARLVTVLSGERWLRAKLDAYFGAQQSCIDQAWHRFVRTGYRQLMPRIKKESHRGNKGIFGSTTLMTYALAGRVMFTFQGLRWIDGGEHQVTYVADDADMHGERSGANAPRTPYAECVAMINEVSDNWDLQKMVRNDKIGMGL